MSRNVPTLLINSLNLPYFETIEELSELTRLSSRLLYCLSTKTNDYYKTKLIPKRNGNLREISIPSDRAMAFRKGKNFGHKQNAYYHADTLYGLAIDLKDFFQA